MSSNSDARMRDALEAIKRHCEPQPSALARAIVATCDNGLKAEPATAGPVPSDLIDRLTSLRAVLADSPHAHWAPRVRSQSVRVLSDAIEALAASQAPAAAPQARIDYTVLYQFAEAARISYNELCRAVETALAAPQAAQPAQEPDDELPPRLLPLETAQLLGNRFRVRTGLVQAIAKAVHAVQAAQPVAPAARSGWQPIETAPRDGSMVLVNDTTPGWTPWVAAHYLDGDEWQGWVYDDSVGADNNPLGPRPTHWMPLPAAPKAEGQPATGERAPTDEGQR